MFSVGYQRWSQLLFASQGFSTTSFSHFCSCNFLNSVLRCFETYKVYYLFIHQQCFLLVTKDGHNFYSHRKVFRRHLSHISLLATSWILFYDALKRIMIITTLFISSVFCWSPKMVTTFFSRRKFFCGHLSDLSVVGTSWMCFTKLWSV